MSTAAPVTTTSLEEYARVARVDTIKELWASQSGHPGSSLSIMDALVALYFGGDFRHDPERADWTERDIFVLSQGHAAPGFYACLALAGYFPRSELDTLRQLDSRLEGHVKRGSLPGIEFSAGSLGQGLGFGAGVATLLRTRSPERHVVVMMSDGEQQEGSTWESAMYVGSHGLGNLTAIVDVNRNQINGPTHEIMPIMDVVADKYRAFGWKALEIDGNAMSAVTEALAEARASDQPTVIVSHTVTGKGVPYMEGDYHWHHGRISNDLFLEAMKALNEPVSSTPDETWRPGASA